MPDATGGIGTGLYWVITGKMPIEDLDEDDDLKAKPDDDDEDAPQRKDRNHG